MSFLSSNSAIKGAHVPVPNFSEQALFVSENLTVRRNTTHVYYADSVDSLRKGAARLISIEELEYMLLATRQEVFTWIDHNISTIGEIIAHNRIGQHSYPLAICKIDEVVGYGVFSMEVIPEGSYIGHYAGQQISQQELDAGKYQNEKYLIRARQRNKEIMINAKQYGNILRFVQHFPIRSQQAQAHICYANMTHGVEYNAQGQLRIAFYATRKIQAFEQLGYDYGENYWKEKQVFLFNQVGKTCYPEKCALLVKVLSTSLFTYVRPEVLLGAFCKPHGYITTISEHDRSEYKVLACSCYDGLSKMSRAMRIVFFGLDPLEIKTKKDIEQLFANKHEATKILNEYLLTSDEKNLAFFIKTAFITRNIFYLRLLMILRPGAITKENDSQDSPLFHFFFRLLQLKGIYDNGYSIEITQQCLVATVPFLWFLFQFKSVVLQYNNKNHYGVLMYRMPLDWNSETWEAAKDMVKIFVVLQQRRDRYVQSTWCQQFVDLAKQTKYPENVQLDT
jgi:hypothetical protein